MTLEEDAEAVQERFSVNDIEHWTSTVVSVLNMLVIIKFIKFSELSYLNFKLNSIDSTNLSLSTKK